LLAFDKSGVRHHVKPLAVTGGLRLVGPFLMTLEHDERPIRKHFREREMI
jgi:hypothetical protein